MIPLQVQRPQHAAQHLLHPLLKAFIVADSKTQGENLHEYSAVDHDASMDPTDSRVLHPLFRHQKVRWCQVV